MELLGRRNGVECFFRKKVQLPFDSILIRYNIIT